MTPPDPPPQELVDAIERVLVEHNVADFDDDGLKELRLKMRAVQQSVESDVALDAIAEAIESAKDRSLARVVETQPESVPDPATADRCGPGEIEVSPLSPEETASINEGLHARQQETRKEIYRQMTTAAGHAGASANAARASVVHVFRGRLVQAMAEYSVCVAEARFAWASLPPQIPRTVEWVSGKAVFGVIGAHVVSAVGAMASAMNASSGETSEGGEDDEGG